MTHKYKNRINIVATNKKEMCPILSGSFTQSLNPSLNFTWIGSFWEYYTHIVN